MGTYFEELESRWNLVSTTYRRLTESLNETVQERDIVEKNHQQLLKDIDTHLKAMEYTKLIMSAVTRQDIAPLENLLSRGLQTVIRPDYSVTIEIDDRGKDKTAEFIVHKTNPITHSQESTPARETGFGVQTVLSLILMVFFLMYEGGAGIMVWDEPLTQVSTEYLDSVFELVKSLILDEGIDILGVTHDVRLKEYGDVVYKMLEGELSLEEVRS